MSLGKLPESEATQLSDVPSLIMQSVGFMVTNGVLVV